MTVPRDTRRPVEYWDEMLDIKHQFVHSKDQVELYHARMQDKKKGTQPLGVLQDSYAKSFLEDITYCYSRGDELDSMKSHYIDEGIDRFIYVCDEMEKYFDKAEIPRFERSLFYPNEIHSAYSMVSWFVCFGADPKKLGLIAPYIAKAGEDRLLDTILQRYEPEREVAIEDKCGKTFKLLQSVLDVNEEKAIQNLEKYLASWGKLMGTLKGLLSIGLTGTKGAKSNESLIANVDSVKNISYRGFWAWEVALVVRFFDIDDSSFCDHEFYPKDLAHYKPVA